MTRIVRCPYCGNAADRVQNQWGIKYECPPCDARVGCHPGTDTPLGTMANASLRSARMAAHAAFDPIWKEHGMRRASAYRWLASMLGISKRRCHIALFDEALCRSTVEHARAFVRTMETATQLTGAY